MRAITFLLSPSHKKPSGKWCLFHMTTFRNLPAVERHNTLRAALGFSLEIISDTRWNEAVWISAWSADTLNRALYEREIRVESSACTGLKCSLHPHTPLQLQNNATSLCNAPKPHRYVLGSWIWGLQRGKKPEILSQLVYSSFKIFGSHRCSASEPKFHIRYQVVTKMVLWGKKHIVVSIKMFILAASKPFLMKSVIFFCSAVQID